MVKGDNWLNEGFFFILINDFMLVYLGWIYTMKLLGNWSLWTWVYFHLHVIFFIFNRNLKFVTCNFVKIVYSILTTWEVSVFVIYAWIIILHIIQKERGSIGEVNKQYSFLSFWKLLLKYTIDMTVQWLCLIRKYLILNRL